MISLLLLSAAAKCHCGHTENEHAKERVAGYRYCHLCREMCKV